MAPRLTVHCTYAGTALPPTCVTIGLLGEYGIHTASEVHDWFLRMLRAHEEFDVETDEPEELPMPFCSETVREVLVE